MKQEYGTIELDRKLENEIKEIMKEMETSRGKTLQRLQKKLSDFEKENQEFSENRKVKIKLEDNIKFLTESIEYQSMTLETQLSKITSFNSKIGLIQEVDNNPIITPYGKIVASLSNCSEVVMGKIIQQRIMEKMEWKTIGILLACFAEDKPEEEDNWEPAKKYLDKKTIEVLDEVWFIYSDIVKLYEEYEIKHRLNMTFGFIIPFINWIEKKPLIEVLKSYDNFDGNFVKNIYKIRDICQEILKVCQNFNLGELQEKINTLLENLIYGIGEFNSLYIHHYDMINSL